MKVNLSKIFIWFGAIWLCLVLIIFLIYTYYSSLTLRYTGISPLIRGSFGFGLFGLLGVCLILIGLAQRLYEKEKVKKK